MKFEFEVTEEEKRLFEKIERMEAVHNELGANLGEYKDNIMEFRNEFVKRLVKKYKIQNPSHMQYDSISGKIVSIFNENAISRKIIHRPHAFKMLASSRIMATIKELSDIYDADKYGRGDR